MSARAMARGATSWNPRGARSAISKGTTPLNPRKAVDTRERAQRQRRRIRDEARDGLSAAAVSLFGSIAVTAALWAVLQWLA
jgi:hypothetical protein